MISTQLYIYVSESNVELRRFLTGRLSNKRQITNIPSQAVPRFEYITSRVSYWMPGMDICLWIYVQLLTSPPDIAVVAGCDWSFDPECTYSKRGRCYHLGYRATSHTYVHDVYSACASSSVHKQLKFLLLCCPTQGVMLTHAHTTHTRIFAYTIMHMMCTVYVFHPVYINN